MNIFFLFLCRPYGEDESTSSSSDDEYEDGHGGYASEPTVGIMDEVNIFFICRELNCNVFFFLEI